MNISVKSLQNKPAAPLAKLIKFPEKQKSPFSARILLTPEIAHYWIVNCNDHNRPIHEIQWMQMACDIIDGRWEYTSQPITFGLNGKMLNGQHTCLACVEAKKGIEVLVTFGLKPAAQNVTDINAPRLAGDIAHLEGTPNANSACALSKMLLYHERFGINVNPRSAAKIENSNGRVRVVWNRPTKIEIVAAARKYTGIDSAIRECHKWRSKLISPRVVMFCYYLFRNQNSELAKQFFDQVVLAENLMPNSATYWLHKRLVDERMGKSRMLPTQLIGLIFKTWIAHRDGRPVKSLRWSSGSGEDFPKI